jgi:hypothetical protein
MRRRFLSALPISADVVEARTLAAMKLRRLIVIQIFSVWRFYGVKRIGIRRGVS